MSESISFLYPITRVGSLYYLLRTTTHSAFPVVTPLISFERPPQNVTNEHVPVLYRKDFTLSSKKGGSHSDENTPIINSSLSEEPKPKPKPKRRSTFQQPNYMRRKRIVRDPMASTDIYPAQHTNPDGLDYSYANPPSKLFSSEDLTDGGENGQKPLVLHGMILRTQLVQLLTRRTFFSNEEQVSFFSFGYL